MQYSPISDETRSPVTRRFHSPDATRLWKGDSCCPAQRVAQSTSGHTTRRRTIYSARKYDQVTPRPPLVTSPERISYRLAKLAFCCQHGITPPYFFAELSRAADDDFPQRLRLVNTVALVIPRLKTRRSVTERFRSPRHASGRVCHLVSRRLHHCQCSRGD